ncbi:Heterogeneous Nuclear Ribonucleoprotein Q [Manis pentadactyla]|nr:Heterogeneous Nuclear Ribonucleoprotein Q [Manis pentadactyla]
MRDATLLSDSGTETPTRRAPRFKAAPPPASRPRRRAPWRCQGGPGESGAERGSRGGLRTGVGGSRPRGAGSLRRRRSL